MKIEILRGKMVIAVCCGIGMAGLWTLCPVGLCENEAWRKDLAPIVQAAVAGSSTAPPVWMEYGNATGYSGNSDPDPELRRLDRHLRRWSRGPNRLHAEGLLAFWRALRSPDLVATSFREAEEDLLAALESDPQRAGAWNDLAAVYLVWAARHDRPRLLLSAFSAAHAARSLDPQSAEARWNASLAFENLGLYHEASAALTGEWPAPVAAEVEKRRATLAGVDPIALRIQFIERLEAAAASGNRDLFLREARFFPSATRRWVEESLLPRWGEAVVNAKSAAAERWLDLARAWGETVTDGGHFKDPMVRESVAAIDAARDGGEQSRLASLAAGHWTFGRGIAAFPDDLDLACNSFRDAEMNLAAASSPFAKWAAFYFGACLHIKWKLPEAMAIFDALTLVGNHFPSLRLRLYWGKGLIFSQLRHSRAALEVYAAGLQLAQDLGDDESVAALACLEAEVQAILSFEEDAWRSLVRALRTARSPLKARYRTNALFSAANQVHSQNSAGGSAVEQRFSTALLELKEAFQNAAVELANSSGLSMSVALNRSRLAATYLSNNRWEEALSQLDAATAAAERISDPTLRAWLFAEMDKAAAGENISITGAKAEPARSALFRNKLRPQQILTELRRAMMIRSLGEELSDLEPIALGLEPVRDRQGFFTSMRRRLRWQIRFLLEDQGTDQALAFYLREQKLRYLSAPIPYRIPDLGAERLPTLPPGSAFVAFLELPNRLVALVLTDRGVVARSLPCAAADLAEASRELKLRIGSPSGSLLGAANTEEIDTLLRTLSRQLVTPLADLLPAEGNLGIALDDLFAALPFEALPWPGDGRPLIERFKIRRLATPRSVQQAPRLHLETKPGLLIGAYDPAPSWRLEPLPSIDVEAAAVRRYFPLADDRVLLGPGATRRAALAQLPTAQWLHFSGHVLEDPADPQQSLLILAEDENRETALSMADLAQFGSQLRLAVLAGCETARAGTGGLAQGLARGGAQVAIGSLWPVEDRSTATFFEDFYRRLAKGAPPADALHETKLAALRSNDARLSSVATWGAFVSWER